jgi:ABC-type ATPase involved in cell division
LIEFNNVEFSHGSSKLLNRLSLTLRRAEYLVITGSARAGKTTLVQMITGMILPDSGEILVNGEDIEDIVKSPIRLRNHRRQIGGIGGIYSLLGDRTVLENIALSPEIAGISPRLARKRAMETMGRYRISHLAGLYSGAISEAERRIAQIARAEAGLKNLIIADMPTDGLDQKAARFINERLAFLHLSGATVLYLTTGSGPQSGPDRYLQLEQGVLRQ